METRRTARDTECDCVIVGGGPAGMMLALLLGRAGLRVVVLEKHGDFLRDFRGDTVHPSTLELLDELGIKQRFDALPQTRTNEMKILFKDGLHGVFDFRSLEPFPYLSFVPQWDFLDFLASEARRASRGFDLRMHHEAVDLIWRNGRIAGVRARTRDGATVQIEAKLTVACDGRNSEMRKAAGLAAFNFGAPMDVLWFGLPRVPSDPEDSFAVAQRGRFLVLLNRTDYWQIAYAIPKGHAPVLQREPIAVFRDEVARRLPLFGDRTAALASWDAVRLLEVRVDQLLRWHRPGLLVIGDAAHAMSPVGAVGINLAVQDAVAAANLVTAPLLRGQTPSALHLAAVQLRRQLPAAWIQAIQQLLQRVIIAPALAASDDPTPIPLPLGLRFVLRFPRVRALPARMFGQGLWREHIAASVRGPAASDGARGEGLA
ncbi:MAG TPA: FAD-dependent oxidoreductase [Polyangiales bacterium]|nr:FAD-dependent oxidoreductase [Polyangiales bacterium]